MRGSSFCLAVFGVVAGALVGVACHSEAAAVDDIGRACAEYCTRATECEEGIEYDGCESTCINTLRGCDIEDMNGAIDDIDLCTGRSCEAVRTCAIDPVRDCPPFDVFVAV